VGIIQGIKRYVWQNAGILIALAVLLIGLSIASDSFLTRRNMLNVFRQISTNAFIAFGMTLVILTGGIDLSSGSVLALVSVLTCGMITNNGFPIAVAVALGILIGCVLGLFNGIIVAKTRVPPFIVTMSMLSMARGGAYLYTGGKPIRVMEGAFNKIANTYIGPISLPIIYIIIFFVILLLVITKTKFGRYVYAVGGNEEAAWFSGVPVERTKIIVYTLASAMCAIAGIILSARMYTGQPTVGSGAELEAIAAVILGGTRLNGGVGSLGGTIIGCFVIGFISNGLNMMGVSSYVQQIMTGVVILLAVFFDSLHTKRK
jgi:ribose transport system permease protein